eukprot:617847-Karenia_brevis.AAC.1
MEMDPSDGKMEYDLYGFWTKRIKQRQSKGREDLLSCVIIRIRQGRRWRKRVSKLHPMSKNASTLVS